HLVFVDEAVAIGVDSLEVVADAIGSFLSFFFRDFAIAIGIGLLQTIAHFGKCGWRRVVRPTGSAWATRIRTTGDGSAVWAALRLWPALAKYFIGCELAVAVAIELQEHRACGGDFGGRKLTIPIGVKRPKQTTPGGRARRAVRSAVRSSVRPALRSARLAGL